MLSPCVDAFILSVLCENPIMKGAFVTLLNTLILKLDQEIALQTASLNRLNVMNQILNLEIQAVQAIIDKVQADFNLILEPIQEAGTCPELASLTDFMQNTAVGKSFAGFQRKLYELNRATNLSNLQNAVTKKRQQMRDDLQSMVDRITLLCP